MFIGGKLLTHSHNYDSIVCLSSGITQQMNYGKDFFAVNVQNNCA